MKKGCFIYTHTSDSKTYCDMCETRLHLGEPVTKVFEHLKNEVLITNYCELCWPKEKKRFKNFENATELYHDTHEGVRDSLIK